jgi:hypothetical protein
MHAPLVSVVLPIHNGERFLQEAVESILVQDCPDFELVIVDDGSTDKTVPLLMSYQKRDTRIRVYCQPNRGLVESLNRGCGIARGKYIARMDADDIAVKERLRWQLEFMESHPAIAVVGGAVQTISASGLELAVEVYPLADRDIKRVLDRGECPFVHPTVLMRRDTFVSVGGYRKAAVHAEDYDLWTRIGDRFELANLDSVVLKYRRHVNQVSIQKCKQQALSALAARTAALYRRNGLDDPLEGIPKMTPSTLARLGVSEGLQRSVVCRAYATCLRSLCDAGEYSAAFKAIQDLHLSDLRCADKAAMVDCAIESSRVFWHKKHFAKSIRTLGCALLSRPTTLGRPLKPFLRRLGVVSLS